MFNYKKYIKSSFILCFLWIKSFFSEKCKLSNFFLKQNNYKDYYIRDYHIHKGIILNGIHYLICQKKKKNSLPALNILNGINFSNIFHFSHGNCFNVFYFCVFGSKNLHFTNLTQWNLMIKLSMKLKRKKNWQFAKKYFNFMLKSKLSTSHTSCLKFHLRMWFLNVGLFKENILLLLVNISYVFHINCVNKNIIYNFKKL